MSAKRKPSALQTELEAAIHAKAFPCMYGDVIHLVAALTIIRRVFARRAKRRGRK